jgi:CDP-diacylglycerol---glycerol-3-phosphate 3-phosphatidyltransferase
MAMTLYALKPAFQSLLRPLVVRLAKAGVTANAVTVSAAIGSIVVGALAILIDDHRIFLLIPVWLLLRMALNAVDGMLAREHGQASRLGAMLNEIGDVVSDAAIYIPFAFIPAFAGGSSPLVIALVIGLALLSEFAGVLGPMIKASRRYDGPMGKSDRALVAGAFGAWIGFGGPVADWAIYGVWIVAALLVLTIANRIRAALREIAPMERQP